MCFPILFKTKLKYKKFVIAYSIQLYLPMFINLKQRYKDIVCNERIESILESFILLNSESLAPNFSPSLIILVKTFHHNIRITIFIKREKIFFKKFIFCKISGNPLISSWKEDNYK